jgi:hypothetical protein
MDEDYLLASVRYVERNPVAARLCEAADNGQNLNRSVPVF